MKTFLKFCFFISITVHVYAQQKTVYGKVLDNSNQALPGATVLIKNSTTGTTTDFDGKFQIEAKSTDTLVFAYVGFVPKEVIVGASNVIKVNLDEDVSRLEEVVVVGYGTTTRKSYTASAATIKRQKRKAYHNKLAGQINSTTLNNSLQGNAAGIQVANNPLKSNNNTQIIIRGAASISKNTKPLIIINGKVSQYRTLEKLDPNTIQNINVLKKTSATAVYGSRGANGVIVISTNVEKNNPEDLLYIVDGMPVKKEHNYIIENFSKEIVDSKKVYNGGEAKKKFGKIAKNGCVVITTRQGNFRISENESYAVINENKFERTSLSPLSTFSIDVDRASYSNIRRKINNGEFIDPDAVKIEEMINYFQYDYPEPIGKHPFSINTEVARTPWHNQTKIVKIGLQGKTYKNEDLPPSNLTFLIDVSGSMSSHNKLPLLKSAFKLLVNQLREKDKVSIVVYAGAAGVVLEPTSGKNKEKILLALSNLKSGGSTAGGHGIKLAYNLAEKNFKKNGNNRVILATDGDFNVGESSDKAMEKLIEEKRKSGVFLSVLGFGYGNYKDSKLETLADKGNGNHAYIDNMQEAQKVFGKEFGATLFTIAKDVKIQIEFNPQKVQAYRLIGYENRLLNDEDFIDDTKDAGELGSGHTVTALYEVIPVGIKSDYLKDSIGLKYTTAQVSKNLSNELFTVKFRYKQPNEDQSIQMVHVQEDFVETASIDLKFASSVALFGMLLRQSKYHNDSKINSVIKLAEAGRGLDKDGYRAEFIRLVSAYQNL